MKISKLKVSTRVFWYVVLVFLYAPLLVVVLFSFNEANTPTHITQFSLKWYDELFGDAVVLGAFRNSIILAVVSSTISTILGAMLGYGVYAHRHRHIGWLIWIIYLPIVTPDIIYGIAELSFFTKVHEAIGILSPGMATMIVAHISFQVPFVALLIYSRLVGLDSRLFDACQDLYANAMQRAWYFIIPTLRPALLAGFFLAFTLSIDDFVISFFTAGPSSTTLPIYIWSAIKKGVTPEINAAATVLIGAVFAAAAVLIAFQYVRRISHARVGDDRQTKLSRATAR